MWTKLRTLPLLPALLALAAVTYVVVRACVIPFTWDESFTWLMYVRGSDWWPEVNSEMSANNHLLNTWLMKLSEMIFGTSEFVLRLPNVLGSLLYFSTAFLFARQQQKPFAQAAVFIILAAHPYLLDYFSLARGYGLAHSLMFFGFWLLWKWSSTGRLHYAVAALCSFSLACFASLTQLHLLAGASVAVAVRYFLLPSARLWEGRVVRIQLLLLPAAITLALIGPYSMKLRQAGALFFGANGSWFRGTWLSLTERVSYGLSLPGFLKDFAAALFLLVALAGIIAATIYFFALRRQKATTAHTFVFLLGTIAAVAVFGPLLQYNLLKTKLLFERTALFYLPLLALMFVQLVQLIPRQQLHAVFYSFAALPFIFITVLCANTTYTRDWPDERDMNLIIEAINKEIPPGKTVALSSDWEFMPSLEFAQTTNKLHANLFLTDRYKRDRVFEYMLVYDRERYEYPAYETICRFSASKSSLLRKPGFLNESRFDFADEKFEVKRAKVPVQKSIGRDGKESMALRGGGEFVFPWSVKFPVPDSLHGKQFRVYARFDARRSDDRRGYDLSVQNLRNGNSVDVVSCRIDSRLPEPDKWYDVSTLFPLRNPVQAGDTLEVFFFFPAKDQILIDNVSLSAHTFSAR